MRETLNSEHPTSNIQRPMAEREIRLLTSAATGERLTILQGDCIEVMRGLPEESVQCVVTSPPDWGLRDYGVEGQIGLEKSPEEYVARMVQVFQEVKRVLRQDGTCWVNLGDSYATNGGHSDKSVNERRSENGISARPEHEHRAFRARPQSGMKKLAEKYRPGSVRENHAYQDRNDFIMQPPPVAGLKAKDLVGIPWRVAFALQADGWYLRSDIIWSKPNPMPESVTDRPTKAHEYIFLLTKSGKYFYDAEAIKETCSESTHARVSQDLAKQVASYRANGGNKTNGPMKAVVAGSSRNKRSVWTVGTAPYAGAHFATFPPELIKPCILAGSAAGDVVLDPFGGSGTTGAVALEFGRRAVLIELNPNYIKLMEKRTFITPGLGL